MRFFPVLNHPNRGIRFESGNTLPKSKRFSTNTLRNYKNTIKLPKNSASEPSTSSLVVIILYENEHNCASKELNTQLVVCVSFNYF
ncbi:hypothetical protein A0O28_0061310 [Trichoderma guizhouense]|uniref:Uncharacterized protein n=1 Tax=Trichoderma guizhouense TaxID=1491466 RepID=A0A1T3CY77_9HYPO|nr:hypothetical protein A0O28_0061310 [Trichoderma guizhouense]